MVRSGGRGTLRHSPAGMSNSPSILAWWARLQVRLGQTAWAARPALAHAQQHRPCQWKRHRPNQSLVARNGSATGSGHSLDEPVVCEVLSNVHDHVSQTKGPGPSEIKNCLGMH
eukprot:4148845-Pleurochrysis_carterae.AAC.1